MAAISNAPNLGRQCGQCSMCCKLMEIKELQKPGGSWCRHVSKGRGCSIYRDRPASCAAFGCGYLHWPMAGDHWFPAKCKMVIVAENETRMAVHVDPSTPNVWKSEPYYSDLKTWARHASRNPGQQLVVTVAGRMFVILPDKDVDMGIVSEDEIVLSGQMADGSYMAIKVRTDDPGIERLANGGYQIR